MKLSTVLELLLILLLVAFAAYARVIDREEVEHHRAVRQAKKQSNAESQIISLKQAAENVNKFCTCNEMICNCCRDFHIPVVQLKGPGCASLQYLNNDRLAVQLSFGDNILTSTVVNGKSPKPVCVPLPGGYSKFCGRIYSIRREDNRHFRACLGLELQSATELEAGLRISCFRFGPDGLRLQPAEPLPVVEEETSEDDDDDDLFGLSDDDDDEDEDEDDEDRPFGNAVPTGTGDDESEDDDDDDDILGFEALVDIFTGDDDDSNKKKTTTAPPLLGFTIPMLSRPTTGAPALTNPEQPAPGLTVLQDDPEDEGQLENLTEEPEKTEEVTAEVHEDADPAATPNPSDQSIATNDKVLAEEASNLVVYSAKPVKPLAEDKVKKVQTASKKKPTQVLPSANAIVDDEKKPASKPVNQEEEEEDDDDDILGTEGLDDDDDEEDDDEDLLGEDEEDEEDEEDDEKTEDLNDEDEDEKTESIEDLDDDDDDDDDDDEEAVLTALVEDDKDEKKGTKKTNGTALAQEEDEDYGMGLSGLLARKRHTRGRQSKVMRL